VAVLKFWKIFSIRTVAEEELEEVLPLATCASTAALEREQKKAPIGTP
jgi:hypothetical protein